METVFGRRSVYERVLVGLGRAKALGRVLGRPKPPMRPERALAQRDKNVSLRRHCCGAWRQCHDDSAAPKGH